MTDEQTLKWWISHANELESALRDLREQSAMREQRIRTAIIERNRAYSERDYWCERYQELMDRRLG